MRLRGSSPSYNRRISSSFSPNVSSASIASRITGSARAVAQFDNALVFQLAVSFRDGLRIYNNGNAPYAGQLLARLQRLCGDRVPHLVNQWDILFRSRAVK